MSDSDVMTAPEPAAQAEEPEQAVQPPTFQELEAQIKEALAAYKKLQSALADIRQALSKGAPRGERRPPA
jgi:hypothetical protein